MLHRASHHSSEAKSRTRRVRRLWLPLAVAAVAIMVMLAPAGSCAASALLSQGRPATASSTYGGHRPRAANDGSLSSSWMGRSGAYPQRWTVDLGARKRLGLVKVHWERANNRVYGYRILGSNNRSVWTVLKNRPANSTIGVTSDTVSGAYHYVRVKVLSSTYGRARIYEVRVYAAGTPAPTQPSNVTVTAYGARGDGVTDDTGAIQAAVNARGTGGGTVTFPAGTYVVSSPIKLPAGNTDVLTLSGYGATISLRNTTPRFLVWNRPATHQTFRKFLVEGFTIDAGNLHPARGHYSVLGFEMQSGRGIYDATYLNVEEVTVKDCTVVNVATSPTSAWNPCVINIYTSQSTHMEATPDYLTDILVQGCHLEGGSRGVNIWAGSGSHSAVNVTLDRVYIRDCWHDTGINPTSFSQSTNYHIGQWAKTGTIELTNNYGARAFDCGVEIDQAQSGLVSGCVEENCYYNEFFHDYFTAPLNGAGQTTYVNCTANVDRSIVGGTGLGIGNGGVTYGRIDLNNFTTNLQYGTKNRYIVAPGVVMTGGLYIDGTKVR